MNNERFTEMLRYRRPAFTTTEEKWIAEFIAPTGAKPDAFGNYSLRIGATPIMWSAHTDTVHKPEGFQELVVSSDDMSIRSHGKHCLGADDASGVWLLLEMIDAGVEGLYVFHRCEEHGGFGSQHILDHETDLIKGIEACIALDRKGYRDVITHQLGGRCASDAFAWSLADALDMGHTPDPTGTFTDSATYMDVIPECTNLSVGYFQQHTRHEWQDLDYLMRLRDALIGIDLSKLIISRNPVETDCEYWDNKSGGYSSDKVLSADDLNDFTAAGDDVDYYNSDATQWGNTEKTCAYASSSSSVHYEGLLRVIKDNPEATADLLEEYGFNPSDIMERA